MSDQKGDLKYYDNQPYDMEMNIEQDDEDSPEQIVNNKKAVEPEENEGTYQEVKVSPPVVKALPKFDISKFEDLASTQEQKELLSIMKR